MVDVSHSYNVNCLTLSTILKSKDKIMEHVNSVVPVILTIVKEAWKSDGEGGETSECGCSNSISVETHSV